MTPELFFFLAVLSIIPVALMLFNPRWALYLEALLFPFQAVFVIQFGANIKVSEIMGVIVVMSWFIRLAMSRNSQLHMKDPIILSALFLILILFVSLAGTLRHWDILSRSSLASVTGLQTGRQAPLSRSFVTAAWAIFSLLNMLATADLIRSRKMLVTTMKFLLAGSFVAALYGFYKLLFLNLPLPSIVFPGSIQTGWSRFWVVMRSDGTFFEPSTMANYFIIMIPLAITGWLMNRGRAWRTVLVAQLMALISTFSPGGWITFALSLLLFLPLINELSHRKTLVAIRNLIIISASLIAALVLVFWITGFDPQPIWLNFMEKTTGMDIGNDVDLSLANASSRVERLALSEISLVMWQYNPILGVGIGNFPFLHPYYSEISGIGFYKMVTTTPSLLYLLILAETGLAGLVALFIFGFNAIIGFHASGKSTKDQDLKWVLYGTAGSVIGIAMNGLVLDNLFVNYYWFILGLGLAARAIALRDDSRLSDQPLTIP